jgi:casein kinase 1
MIVNKYKIGEEIARGAFGCISKGLYVKKNEPVAIKIEYGDIQSLKHEVKILNFLSMSGVKKIPNIYWYGIFNENPCLIFTLFEYSLFDYMKKKEITIEKMNILMRKAIDIIEHIHKKYVLHRDIKPQNFMIKDGDIFLIDFGLATFYIDENGQHYPNKKSDSIIGSPKFVSINVHNGHRYSRRDDMISLAYMYMYMILGDAPWFTPLNRVSNNMNVDSLHIEHPINQMLRSNKHYDAFSQYTQSISCIDKYIQYTYALEYTDVPKYEPLALLFSLHT